jgi:uncharacterized membrane protein
MSILIAGLVLFLGMHSVRIVADHWRNARVAQLGQRNWKLIYTFVSLLGFALIIWGFGQARASTGIVWEPPAWTSRATSLLLLPAFVLIVAGNMRGTKMKAALGHPMVLGTGLWAFAHLIGNGRLAGVVLFGSFLVWTIAAYVAARRRDAAAGVVYPTGSVSKDLIAAVIGVAAWAVFGFWLHTPLIGLRPFA